MPIVQLQNDAPENLGRAIGAVGGYFATQKQRKADKQQAQADKARTNAQEDAAAADRHADLMSAIAERDANIKHTESADQAKETSRAAYGKYLPMINNPPTQPGQPPLTGPALAKALHAIGVKAAQEGMTQPEDTAAFNLAVQQRLAADKQQSTQNFLDKETKTPVPTDPQQQLNFLLKHRLPAERAAGIDTKDTMALIAEAQRQINEANLEKQRAAQNQNAAQRIQIQLDRPPADRVPRNAQGLTPEEVIQNQHWAAEHPNAGKKPAKLSTPEARGADYAAAANAIAKGADRDAVIQRFAAKWNLTPDKADALFP